MSNLNQPPQRSQDANTIHPQAHIASAIPGAIIVTKFLITAQLHPGDQFYDGRNDRIARDLIMQCGLPNSFSHASVVTNLKTQVLRISRLDFNKFATKATWHAFVDEDQATAVGAGHSAHSANSQDKMAAELMLSEAYISKRAWDLYKRRVVKQLMAEIRRKRRLECMGHI